MAISKRTRYEVLKRDNFTCRYCRETEGKIVVDHVVPVALGGSDDPDNLVAACHDCNAGKSSTSPTEGTVADVTNDSIRWAAAMKLAAQRVTDKRGPAGNYIDAFFDEWDTFCEGTRFYDPVLPENWRTSVEHFYKVGLPASELSRAMNISMTKAHVHRTDKFRYMAGVCWSIVTELQDEAKKLLTQDEVTD